MVPLPMPEKAALMWFYATRELRSSHVTATSIYVQGMRAFPIPPSSLLSMVEFPFLVCAVDVYFTTK